MDLEPQTTSLNWMFGWCLVKTHFLCKGFEIIQLEQPKKWLFGVPGISYDWYFTPYLVIVWFWYPPKYMACCDCALALAAMICTSVPTEGSKTPAAKLLTTVRKKNSPHFKTSLYTSWPSQVASFQWDATYKYLHISMTCNLQAYFNDMQPTYIFQWHAT